MHTCTVIPVPAIIVVVFPGISVFRTNPLCRLRLHAMAIHFVNGTGSGSGVMGVKQGSRVSDEVGVRVGLARRLE